MTSATLTLEDGADARTVRLGGSLTIAEIGAITGPIGELRPDGRPLVIDASGVDRFDTIGAWLVYKLERDWAAAGARVRLDGIGTDGQRLIDEVKANDAPCEVRRPRGSRIARHLATVGHAVISGFATLGAFLGFLGMTLVALFQSVFERRPLRWNAVVHQGEVIGVNALGIVGLLSFLVGLVLAQQGEVQLKQFGADVFVVNLIGRATFRELGVLLTAIMVAGRSGSAFAAQIGSMKLAQEIDAMTSIGMSPTEVLVLPRVIAMAVMMTLLGFYGSLLAVIGGGLYCWVALDIPPVSFVERLRDVVPLSDLLIGTAKAPVFGIIIAVTGCFQGMQVTGNAESVGLRTTAAVVQSIFLVIVLDAFFAVFFSALGFV